MLTPRCRSSMTAEISTCTLVPALSCLTSHTMATHVWLLLVFVLSSGRQLCECGEMGEEGRMRGRREGYVEQGMDICGVFLHV